MSSQCRKPPNSNVTETIVWSLLPLGFHLPRFFEPFCLWATKYPAKEPLSPKVVSMENKRRQQRTLKQLRCRKYSGVVLSRLFFWNMETILYFKVCCLHMVLFLGWKTQLLCANVPHPFLFYFRNGSFLLATALLLLPFRYKIWTLKKLFSERASALQLAALSLHLLRNGPCNDGFYRAGMKTLHCILEHQLLFESWGCWGMLWEGWSWQGGSCQHCLNQRLWGLTWQPDGLFFLLTQPSATLGGAACIFMGENPRSESVITPDLQDSSKRRQPDSQSWSFCPVPLPSFSRAKKLSAWCFLPYQSSLEAAWPWLRIAAGQSGEWIAFVEGMRLGQMWLVESGFEKIGNGHVAVGMCMR